MEENEIVKELNRLKIEIDRLEKEVNKPKDETIYVPKGILVDRAMEIINGNHTLCHDEDGWYVISWGCSINSTENQYKLVPCERNELETGDVAFRAELQKPNFKNLDKYCVIIDEGYQYWAGKNCAFSNFEWNYWFKVVKA